ncbi:hypothetical protein, partial [Cronobacter sakazakii]|uniref:hypothetical protein n=1 Tax=Cronobacter sakazakii TaxID=28141 RepID=UPI000D514D32
NTKKARDMRALNIWSNLFVVAGADLRLTDSHRLMVHRQLYAARQVPFKATSATERISLRIHHNGKSTE